MPKRRMPRARALVTFSPLLPLALLAACGTAPRQAPVSEATPPARTAPTPQTQHQAQHQPQLPVLPPAGSGRGGYYQDDGPGDRVPDDVLATPDAEPRIEPYAKRGNKPYVVFGKSYTPFLDDRPFKQRGRGSWYGRKFHGQKTSSGEPYDMYQMTAAHPTMPIPSYARVTNLANGRQVIVRVNDRGPFHANRIIDLSYTAALKLGYLQQGSAELEVERLLPDEIARMAAARAVASPSVANAPVVTQPVAAQPVAVAADAGQPARAASEPAGVSVYAVPVVSAVQTAAVPPAASAAPVATPMAGAGGFYLQLGAFSQPGGAESVRANLQQNAAGVLPSVDVVEQGGMYRVFAGPFATRQEAEAAFLKLPSNAAARPLVVQR